MFFHINYVITKCHETFFFSFFFFGINPHQYLLRTLDRQIDQIYRITDKITIITIIHNNVTILNKQYLKQNNVGMVILRFLQFCVDDENCKSYTKDDSKITQSGNESNKK